GLFTRVAMIRNPVLQFIRNHMMALAGKLTAVQERAVAQLTEMAVHYPDSPLTADDPGAAWHGEVKSGDRLPDADLYDATGAGSARLLKTIGGSQHTLLLVLDPQTDSQSRNSTAELIDQATRLAAEFDGLLRLVMVAPSEGHVPGSSAT